MEYYNWLWKGNMGLLQVKNTWAHIVYNQFLTFCWLMWIFDTLLLMSPRTERLIPSPPPLVAKWALPGKWMFSLCVPSFPFCCKEKIWKEGIINLDFHQFLEKFVYTLDAVSTIMPCRNCIGQHHQSSLKFSSVNCCIHWSRFLLNCSLHLVSVHVVKPLNHT